MHSLCLKKGLTEKLNKKWCCTRCTDFAFLVLLFGLPPSELFEYSFFTRCVGLFLLGFLIKHCAPMKHNLGRTLESSKTRESTRDKKNA